MFRFAPLVFLTCTWSLFGSSATDADSLQDAIYDANEVTSTTITFSNDITLNSSMKNPYYTSVNIRNLLPLGMDGKFVAEAMSSITVNGGGNSLIGAGGADTRGFFVRGGIVVINNLAFKSLKAQGGYPGGGGLGGALFVDKDASVTLNNCSFDGNSATGGSPTSGHSTSSGGGFTGNGESTGGGGGLFGVGGFGGGGGAAYDSPSDDGGSSFDDTNGGIAPGGDGGSGGGGAAGETSMVVDAGNGGDGGGGGRSVNGNGGNGGEFGGGGMGTAPGGNGGNGGFAGAGGFAGVGGDGGFSGGGGGATITPGTGGFGGADASSTLTGGGAGFGGAIFVRQGGSLTFTGTLSFSNSSVTAGGSGALASGTDIFAMSESELIFDLSQDFTMPSPIEGNQGKIDANTPDVPTYSGGLTKEGSFRFELVGDNTYTGMTTINAGDLRVNGSLITNVVINAGGTFSGISEIKKDIQNHGGNITTNNNGRFEPGNDGVGTVIIDGDYTQSSGATFAVDITPTGQSDVVSLIAGSGSLDGEIEVYIGTGNYVAGTQYTVIDGPTTGAFSQITKVGPNADNVNIGVSYSSAIITILTNRVFQDQIINSGIPQEVANCIIEASEMGSIEPGSDFEMVVQLLGMLSNSEVNKALIQLAPQRFGSLEWINARNNSWVADILAQHLFDLCCDPRDCCDPCANTEGWIAGYGIFTDQRKRIDNLYPFDTSGGGVIGGIDWCCNPCFYFGVAAGYTHTGFDWNQKSGSGLINTYYGALYGSWLGSCLSMDLAFIGGGSHHDIKREIAFTGLSREAKSDPWGYFFTGHLGARGDWDCSCFTFEPFAKVDYHYFDRESFKEKGAQSLNLKVRSNDQHFIRGEAGLRAYYTIHCDCFCWAPFLGASWVGDFPLFDSDQKASFVGQSCVIDVESYDTTALQMGSPEAGFKVTNECGFSLFGEYKGIFNDKVLINQFDLRLEWIF